MKHERLICRLEKKIAMAKEVLAEIEKQEENHDEEDVLYGADGASILQLIQISGYFQVLLRKLKRGETISKGCIKQISEMESTFDESMEKLSR